MNFLSENRNKFRAVPIEEINYYYENQYHAIRTGYVILQNIETAYGINMSDFEDYFQKIKAKYDLIINADSEMKSKKIEAPRSLAK